MKIKVFFSVLFGTCLLTAVSCHHGGQINIVKPFDYSIDTNWMVKSETTSHDVDLFYIYPTCLMSGNTPAGELNEEEKLDALCTYYTQAHCMSEYTNVYAPYYRQVSIDYIMKIATPDDFVDTIRNNAGKADIFAALDYFFTNFNNNRPFILASHSQGSAMMRIVLDEYMPSHPEYYSRMVAAYPIGFSYPKTWMSENNLKGATKADDYGVIVTWNTEGPNATLTNFLVTPDDYVINPLTWSTNTEMADTSLNLGSFVWDNESQFTYHIQTPGLFDAQIDSTRVALICTTVEDYLPSSLFGDKSLHLDDWGGYYANLKANGQTRINAYLGR